MSTNMNTKEVGMTFTQTKMLSNEEQHVNEIRNNMIKRRTDTVERLECETGTERVFNSTTDRIQQQQRTRTGREIGTERVVQRIKRVVVVVVFGVWQNEVVVVRSRT